MGVKTDTYETALKGFTSNAEAKKLAVSFEKRQP